MDKIKCFIECLIPVTACNLKCEYCYIIQENRRKNQIPKMLHTPEYIAKCLSKKRLGGVSYISICGAGETLLADNIVNIISYILNEGHYVNITTNGTITKKFEEISKIDSGLLKKLHFAFSFHYLELVKTNNLDNFFNNINLIKNLGCSFVVQINLYDNYIEHFDTIKKLCLDKLGALPQVAATRDEMSTNIKLLTKYTVDEYKSLGDQFLSPLFKFTMSNFMIKRKEFCYAGDWSYTLNMLTGELKQCYFSKTIQNIYDNPEAPIVKYAVGKKCKNYFCTNSSHFMSLGIIPEIVTPTYAQLRNRKDSNWYNEDVNYFLNSKLFESNNQYSKIKKDFYFFYDLKFNFKSKYLKLKNKLNKRGKK